MCIVCESVEFTVGRWLSHYNHIYKIDRWINICANKNIDLHNYVIKYIILVQLPIGPPSTHCITLTKPLETNMCGIELWDTRNNHAFPIFFCEKNPKFEILQSFVCDKQLVEKKLQAHNNYLQTYWDIEKIDYIKKLEKKVMFPTI